MEIRIHKILLLVTQCACAMSWIVDLALFQDRCQFWPGEDNTTTGQSQWGQPLLRRVNAAYEGGSQAERELQ